jgi:hypothetical protein
MLVHANLDKLQTSPFNDGDSNIIIFSFKLGCSLHYLVAFVCLYVAFVLFVLTLRAYLDTELRQNRFTIN